MGIPKEYFIEGMESSVEKAVMAAIDVIKKLGAQVHEVSLPHTQYAVPTYYLIATAEASSNLARYDGIRYGNDRSFFGDEAKRRIMLGTYALSAGYYDQYYNKAQKVRTVIVQDFKKAFSV